MRRVVIVCDSGGSHGLGHLVRCLAVAEEAVGRGWSVVVVGRHGDQGRDLLERASGVRAVAVDHGVDLVMAIDRVIGEVAPDVVHLDDYDPVLDAWTADAPVPVSNMQDATFGARRADLVVDANLGSEQRIVADLDRSTAYGLGVGWAPLRSTVTSRAASWRPTGADRPRVLVVMGGTDPLDLSPPVVAAVHDAGIEVDLTVVAPPRLADAVVGAGGSLAPDVRDFVDDLPALVLEHDLVISSAGTSVWELCCLGAPMALVQAVPNQADGYRAVVDRGAALGLGEPPVDPSRVAAALTIDGDTAARLSATGREVVDGLGAWRIVSAWEHLADQVPTPPTDDLVVRPATPADAETLLRWRNDPDTRSQSRDTGEVALTDHLAWLERTLARPDVVLLVGELEGTAIGTVRWDHLGGPAWEVSITVAPEARGGGLSGRLLAAGERHLVEREATAVQAIATVRAGNEPSERLFRHGGYLPERPVDPDGFRTFGRWFPRA